MPVVAGLGAWGSFEKIRFGFSEIGIANEFRYTVAKTDS